jgi:FtsP/CotA-like multicopper oxidase with cupredoxin domain
MKFISGLFVVFSALFPTVTFGQICSNADTIVDPEQFDWEQKIGIGSDSHYVGMMEIAEETISVGNDNITTRIYRQSGGNSNIPGPTLVMKPGEKYVLRFGNLLPYETRSEEHNVFKDPNVSNLHTHGLHISGESPGDDVTRNFVGGEGGDFVYDIPIDHMGGTFWYHAHHHGSTFLQVSAGAFGLIVIDDSADNIPTNVADMEERQLVVAFLDPDVAGTGGDALISGTLSPTNRGVNKP